MRRSSLIPIMGGAPFRVQEGEVARPSPLTVLIPAYSGEVEYPDVTWMGSGQVPARGARVLVAIDNDGGVWAFPAEPSPVQPGMRVAWNGTPPAGWESSISVDGVQFYEWTGVL